MKCTIVGQMASIKEYSKTKEKGLKVANFVIADIEEKETFYYCRAYGQTAEYIEKYYDLKDKSGKLISRKLVLHGKLRHYQKREEIESKGSITIAQALSVLKELDPLITHKLTKEDLACSIDCTLKGSTVSDNYAFDVESVISIDKVEGQEKGMEVSLSKKVIKDSEEVLAEIFK